MKKHTKLLEVCREPIYLSFLSFAFFLFFPALPCSGSLKSEVHTQQKDVKKLKVSGTVLDADGLSIIGASVLVQGTSLGTITDFDGNFTLDVPNENSILVFSYVGFNNFTVTVGKNRSFTIKMKEASLDLDEVVVVGYATQKKVNLTGAVTSVGSKELANIPSSNVTSMLQGKLPGVSITQSNALPGREQNSIRIRGIGTMNNANPMILVDGIESNMNDINPNDIENVSVLKDAAAASIYGTRAANGVILITTKRGKKGKATLSYDGYVGFQDDINRIQHLPSDLYCTLYNEGLVNEGKSPVYTDEIIEKYRTQSDPDNYPNTDWAETLLKGSGFTQNHHISLKGGSEDTKYTFSLGYYDQAGIIKRTNFERYNVRFNIDSKVNKWLDLGVNSAISYGKREMPSNSGPNASRIKQENLFRLFIFMNRIPPTIVNRYSDGSWGRYFDGNPNIYVENGGTSKSDKIHASGSSYAQINLLEGLTLKGVAGVDYTFDDAKLHIKNVSYHDGTVQGPNSVSDYLTRNMTVTLQALLNYKKDWNNHHLKVLLGASSENYIHKYTQAFRKNIPNSYLTDLDAGSKDGWSNSGNSYESSIRSFFGRINYDYLGKYLFEANVRMDGSSKFSEGNKWGTFPSFSFGWRASEEGFLKDFTWLNNLKLRLSWGQLGNHRINNYCYLPLLASGIDYTFADEVASGVAQTKPNNNDVTWETTTEYNFGLDFSFWKGLLGGSIDYYNRYTDDILTTVPVTYVYGLPAPVSNAGAMRNSGIEIALSHRNQISKFDYGISGYLAVNKNRVERYPNPSKGETLRMEGEAWNSFYGYECIGQFMSDEEAKNSPTQNDNVGAGDLKFKDQNGDNKINGDDRIVLGNQQPNITYGFSLNASYRNFDLVASFQGAADVYRMINDQGFWPFIEGAKAQYIHLDRTLVENGKVTQLGHYPKTHAEKNYNRVVSSFSVLNSSYLRLKNLQLGYSFPSKWIDKLNISRARVYVSATNLFTLTSFPFDFDPEVSSGYASTNYPQVATYTLGLNLTF